MAKSFLSSLPALRYDSSSTSSWFTPNVDLFLLDHIYESDDQVEDWDYELGRQHEEDIFSEDLNWIVPHDSKTRVKSRYIHYGNEASIADIYGDLVLIATVQPKGQHSV